MMKHHRIQGLSGAFHKIFTDTPTFHTQTGRFFPQHFPIEKNRGQGLVDQHRLDRWRLWHWTPNELEGG
jgi:hypothetical protein